MDFPDIEDSINTVPSGGFYFAEKLKDGRKKEAVAILEK